jgi:hypothetical protein
MAILFSEEELAQNRDMRRRLKMPEAEILRECNVDTYRSSGPGGQKKNKTYSAVRLAHRPTGITVVATESRSQHENKSRAVRRLRRAIALKYRLPVPEAVIWPERIDRKGGQLRVSERNPAAPVAIALVLDALEQQNGILKGAAAELDVSSSSLTRFLFQHPKAWGEANRIRKMHGHGPLKK